MECWELLPKDFLKKTEKLFSKDTYGRILTSFCAKRPTTIRANPLKITPEDLAHQLKSLGFEVEPVPWYGSAFVLTSGTLRALTEAVVYKEGFLYVQSLSSMIPPLILAPKEGEKVLDIAAAPGSKTTQIAALTGNTGEIVANDISQIRLYRLQANLTLQGVTNTKVQKGLAETIWKTYPEYFDKVLVDAPCSMEGRFYSEEPKSYKDWSTRKVKELAEKQRWMLRSAISATKPGGTIVYSTCTLSPEENEGVIDWILKKEKGNIVLENISLTGFSFDPTVAKWGDKIYNPEITKCARIYPTQNMEGFFVARIRKLRSTVPGSAKAIS